MEFRYSCSKVYWLSKKQGEASDNERIEAEFKKRNLPYLMAVQSKGELSGSAFFPIVPAPKALVVRYKTEKKTGTLKVALKGLEKLHIKKDSASGAE